MIGQAFRSHRDQHRQHKKHHSFDVSFSSEDDSRNFDYDSSSIVQDRQVEEVDRNASQSSLRLRIETIVELTRSASGLDVYFVSLPICNALGLQKGTIASLQKQLTSASLKDDILLVKEGSYQDAALGKDPWAFSLVSTTFNGPGLICLRNSASSHTSPVLNHLRTALQQCIEDQNTLKKQSLSQQLAVEIGRQAQNETLLDISAPGKSSRNLQQMGNVDLDVNIFANAADYLCRIIPAVQGCVIFDLTEFRMTVTSAQSRSHTSSHPEGLAAGAAGIGAGAGIETMSSLSGSGREDSSKDSDEGAAAAADSSTALGTGSNTSTRTSLPMRAATSSSKGGDSVVAEQSVASEGGRTHCSYLPTPTPIRILGFFGKHREHFDNLSGTVSKPIIAQHLSMSRSSGLNSKTFVERSDSSNLFKISSLAPSSAKTYICSSVAEADAQPAYLIFAFSDQEKLHFTQTEELFLEQLGAYLIYSSIRSRVVAVDRAQMRFTQRIQHELRTPLHAIIGVNEIAKQSLSHSFNLDEMSDLVESIGTSADTLSLLIDDMVDFSLMERLSGERRLMQTERVYSDWESICSVVTSTCLHGYQLSQRISRLDQKMKVYAKSPPEMFVYLPDLYNFNWKEYKAQVDLEIVRRIVWKLVMNAIQATKKGIICITVSRKSPNEAVEAGSNTERLEIEIADTGKGMEQRFVDERLFQPFGKEDEESQGVGLSLSICQVLTSQLSGRLSAKSKVNVGTQMLVSLPLRKTSRRESHQKSHTSNGVTIAFVGFETNDKRLYVNKFLNQFRLKESKDLLQAQLVVIAFDDPDVSIDCTKEIDLLRSRESKAQVVIMPTLILQELDEARSTRMEALELALGQETRLIHRPMTVAEIQEFASIIDRIQSAGSNKGSLAGAIGDALFESASNDIQTISLHSRMQKSNSPNMKYMEIPRRSSATSDDPSMDHPYCILVVEDNPLNARIMTTMLKKAGFDYMLATDGRQGVEAFKKNLPHLVLLDINMPVMDGFDACKAMRSIVSPYKHRIIAITALSTEAERRKGKESGMDDWLTKPTRMAPLLRNIRRWKKQYEGVDTSDPSTPSSGGAMAA